MQKAIEQMFMLLSHSRLTMYRQIPMICGPGQLHRLSPGQGFHMVRNKSNAINKPISAMFLCLSHNRLTMYCQIPMICGPGALWVDSKALGASCGLSHNVFAGVS